MSIGMECTAYYPPVCDRDYCPRDGSCDRFDEAVERAGAERVRQEMDGFVKKTDIIKRANCKWHNGDCTACDFATDGDSWCEGEVFVVNILGLPAADVVPVRRGKWIEDGYNEEQFVCSECGEPCTSFCMEKPRWNYCPWCGAKMEVDE